MKALSMLQPYAWLFVNGYLTVDDRTWSTLYRGPLVIHASKNVHERYDQFLRAHTQIPMPPLESMERGGIVGIVTLADCLAPLSGRGTPNGRPQLHRSHFGASGYYGLVFENPRKLDFIAYRGNKGLFEVPNRVIPLES